MDVTDTFDRGVTSLHAHEIYIRGLGSDTFAPEEFLEGATRRVGTRLGCRYGVAFEAFPLNYF